jgi:hypothetical protein
VGSRGLGYCIGLCDMWWPRALQPAAKTTVNQILLESDAPGPERHSSFGMIYTLGRMKSRLLGKLSSSRGSTLRDRWRVATVDVISLYSWTVCWLAWVLFCALGGGGCYSFLFRCVASSISATGVWVGTGLCRSCSCLCSPNPSLPLLQVARAAGLRPPPARPLTSVSPCTTVRAAVGAAGKGSCGTRTQRAWLSSAAWRT